MAHILVTYKIPDAGITLLKASGHEVTVHQGEQVLTPEEVKEAVGTYDAMLTMLTEKITPEVIAAAGPQLKIIANYAVGYDNIDVKAATAKGITITNTPDVLTNAVAEHTVALMIAQAKRIVESDTFLRAGKYIGWRPELLLGTELKDKVLGIVGAGRIGREVARHAKLGFDMHIAYSDIKQDPELDTKYAATYYAKLEEMLPIADVISIHVPLLPATQHLINAKRLALMKITAILVNTSRGPVVDEAALVEALKAGTIAGAALDVFEHEPALTPGLAELPNVTLTPHTASATREARNAMAELAAKNILAVLAGQPAVTPVKAA